MTDNVVFLSVFTGTPVSNPKTTTPNPLFRAPADPSHYYYATSIGRALYR